MTLTYIFGILLGVLATSIVLYIFKLLNEVKIQKKLIKEQYKLIEILTNIAFGDEIKEHLEKKDCCDKESAEPQPEKDDSAHTTGAASE